MVEHGRQGEIAVFQLQLAGLDLRNVEDVVDDRQQVLAGCVDLAQPLGLACRGLGAQQVGEAEDGVHRRADFVRHVAQEGALRPACCFGAFLGAGQFWVRSATAAPVRC